MLIAILAVLAGGCARSAADPGPSGLFDVGDGRKLFLDCQGSGSPTVFIIPGKGSYAEAWNFVVPPNDPIRSSPYDIITQAKLTPSPDAVATDRGENDAGLRIRPAQHPARRCRPVNRCAAAAWLQQDVDDVVALIGAAQLPGPFVFVAHSYGGLIADLLARTRPDLVAGLVMVDPVSEFLETLGTPAQNAAWERDSMTPPEPGDETVLVGDAIRSGPDRAPAATRSRHRAQLRQIRGARGTDAG